MAGAATEARAARPRISVVTATLNRRDRLASCIASVAAQSYPAFEHVVVDGASTDGTPELLADLAGTHPHLRWISQPDTGISQALNRGLALANGDLVGVIGDDDRYLPDALECIAEAAVRHPAAGVISGSSELRDNAGRPKGVLQASYRGRRALIEWWRHWGRDVALPAPSTFIRADALAAAGDFEEHERFAMDYHHWLKLTERFDVVTIDRVLAVHRSDEGAASFSGRIEAMREMHEASRRYWGSRRTADYYRFRLSYLRHHQWGGLKHRVRLLAGRPPTQ
jgi:glycosyltransferase involved in cell wall biosynthesis